MGIRVKNGSHEHAENYVLQEIKRTYNFQDSDLIIDPKLQNSLKKWIGIFLSDDPSEMESFSSKISPEWVQRRNECIGFSKDTKKVIDTEKVDSFAHDVMMRYAKAFFLRGKVHENYHKNPSYRNPTILNKMDMIDIYMNHITNDAQTKLESFGFNRRSALSLQGALINNIIDIYEESAHYPNFKVVVNPLVPRPKTDQHAEEIVKTISGHWQYLVEVIEKNKQKSPPKTI